MGFQFCQVHELNAGLKCQTRRVVKDGETLQTSTMTLGKYRELHFTVRGRNGRIKWISGSDYAAVPGRGKKAFGRIEIVHIKKQRLQHITEQEAHREGVKDVREFQRLWQSINGKKKGARWEDNPEVWVITFRFFKPFRP